MATESAHRHKQTLELACTLQQWRLRSTTESQGFPLSPHLPPHYTHSVSHIPSFLIIKQAGERKSWNPKERAARLLWVGNDIMRGLQCLVAGAFYSNCQHEYAIVCTDWGSVRTHAHGPGCWREADEGDFEEGSKRELQEGKAVPEGEVKWKTKVSMKETKAQKRSRHWEEGQSEVTAGSVWGRIRCKTSNSKGKFRMKTSLCYHCRSRQGLPSGYTYTHTLSYCLGCLIKKEIPGTP